MTTRAVPKAVYRDGPEHWPVRVPCRRSPKLFFNPSQATARAAQRICASCPMLTRCAEYARAVPQRATDGVFASVLMPPWGERYDADREAALAELERVAATGVAAAPAEGRRVRTSQWDQADRLETVLRLRDVEGRTWRQIADRLECSEANVRRIYTEYLAALDEELAS